MVTQFHNLTLNERANLLWSKGKFLTTLTYYKRKVNLYIMDDEHYEAWYDVAGNLVEKIIPMEHKKFFAKYFQEN